MLLNLMPQVLNFPSWTRKKHCNYSQMFNESNAMWMDCMGWNMVFIHLIWKYILIILIYIQQICRLLTTSSDGCVPLFDLWTFDLASSNLSNLTSVLLSQNNMFRCPGPAIRRRTGKKSFTFNIQTDFSESLKYNYNAKLLTGTAYIM